MRTAFVINVQIENYHQLYIYVNYVLCSLFAGNGLWHHHVLGGQQCGSAEGALRVPFDRCWQAGSANQLHRGQSNVGLIRGLLP